MDSDHIICFWIKELPYIWIPNKNIDQCKRYYLVDQNTFAVFNNQNEITNLTSLIKNLKNSSAELEDYSIIPIETNNKKCKLVRNMFLVALVKSFFRKVDVNDVYNLYNTDDVRIEGKKINESKAYQTKLNKYTRIDISHYVRYDEHIQLYNAAFGRAVNNILNVNLANKSLFLTTAKNGTQRYNHLAEARTMMNIPKNRLKIIHLEALNNAYNLIKNKREIIPKHKLGLDSWLHDETIELIEIYINETDENYKIIQNKQYGLDDKYTGWLYYPKYARYDIMQIIYETLIGKRKVYKVINL